MEAKLEWLTEEEGQIVVFENQKNVLTAEFFVTGEEEAEFRIQDVVFEEKTAEIDKMSEEIIQEMTKYILECFRLLWAEDMEEVVLVEPQGTKMAEILDSTVVVENVYKEYMMRRYLNPQKTTDCGQSTLKLTKEENGFCCENAEHTFFCRLLEYELEKQGETCFYLYEVEVSEKKRNLGIATTCLKELFQLLSAEAPVVIFLQVGSYKEPAVHLYHKLGFEISEALCYYAATE